MLKVSYEVEIEFAEPITKTQVFLNEDRRLVGMKNIDSLGIPELLGNIVSIRMSKEDQDKANSVLFYASHHSLFNELRETGTKSFRLDILDRLGIEKQMVIDVKVDWNALLFANIDWSKSSEFDGYYPLWARIWKYKIMISGNPEMFFVRKIISETQLFNSINLIYESDLSRKIAFYSCIIELTNNQKIIRVTDIGYSELLKPQQATAYFEQMWKRGYLMKLRRGQYRKPPRENWKKERPPNWREITTFSIEKYEDEYGWQALSDWDALLRYWRKQFWEAKYKGSMDVIAGQVKGQEYPEPLLEKLRGIYVEVRG